MRTPVKVGIVAALALTVLIVILSKHPAAPPSDVAPGRAAASGPAQTVVALPRLVDLGSDKCIPCKKMAPILEELKTTLAAELQVEFIDVWKDPQAGKEYGVSVIPTQIFYDAQGKELSRHEGFMPREDILARFKSHGIDLSGLQ